MRQQIDHADPTKSINNEPLKLVEHHKRILNHVFTPNRDGRLKYKTIVFSCPKKSAKTAIAGAVTYGVLRTYGGNCYSIANDEKQASSRMFDRVRETLEIMRTHNPVLFEKVVELGTKGSILHGGDKLVFKDNDQPNPGPHWLQFIAQDYAGEAGGMPALTVWDELWGYVTKGALRLWDEMCPIPTIPISIRFISTYAGWYGESTLLYSIYEAVVKPDPHDPHLKLGTKVPGLEDLPCYTDGSYFVYWDHEARMPWHTPEFMADAQNDPSLHGRESEYRRIWKNEWTTGAEAYLSIDIIDKLMAEGDAIGLVNHMEGW